MLPGTMERDVVVTHRHKTLAQPAQDDFWSVTIRAEVAENHPPQTRVGNVCNQLGNLLIR